MPQSRVDDIRYLHEFSNKLGKTIYQGKDLRTMMHNDIIGFDGTKFIEHELTYGAYLGNYILPCIGIIIPDIELKGRVYEAHKQIFTLHNDIKDFYRYE